MPPTLPVHLLLLDMIGVVLVGIGLFEQFSGTSMLPEALRDPGLPWVMIACGVLLMLPLVVHFIAMARRGAR
jgi:hypothetical protein